MCQASCAGRCKEACHATQGGAAPLGVRITEAITAAPGAASMCAAPLQSAPHCVTPCRLAPHICRATTCGAALLSPRDREVTEVFRAAPGAAAIYAAPSSMVPHPAAPPAVAPHAWSAAPQSLSAPWRGVDAQACRAMGNGAAPPYIIVKSLNSSSKSQTQAHSSNLNIMSYISSKS
jgi:hypothetical protein